jgi:hypothetical protein
MGDPVFCSLCRTPKVKNREVGKPENGFVVEAKESCEGG